MNSTATTANLFWAASNLPAWIAFRRGLQNPRAAQAGVLGKILRRASHTAFGREHRFERIKCHADFISNVPLRDYAEFEPWISRVRQGEPNVLTGEPVKRLATTSGTSGARKLIPYTAGLQAQFNCAIGPWIIDLFRTYPSLIFGSAYWSVSPVARNGAELSKVPIGFEDDAEYLGGFRARLVNAVMAVPAHVRNAPTTDEWRRQTIEHLRKRHDLRLISVWHPSYLSLLLDQMPSSPQALWPRLTVVSCWGDGHASLALEDLRKRLPQVVLQSKGLLATEGVISVPFAGRWPLAIRSHYFEFLKSDGSTALAHELCEGETYDVALTTAGGLYRYLLHDRVRVGGFVGKTPSIRFVGKSANISDLFGEKLSEAFVGEVVRRLMCTLEIRWPFAMLAPDGSRYTLFLEGDAPDRAASLLDAALCENPQYAYCRDLGQLSAATICPVSRPAWPIYVDRLTANGQVLGDIKPVALSGLTDWGAYFSTAADSKIYL